MVASTPLREALKRYWGYDAFRPLQRDAIECVMEGRDSVVVLPTGGGKSLCYQAPALVREGAAIVVSPLISLMKDQVDALRANGVPAACIHSGLAASERRDVDREIRDGHVKILYVSPERLAQQRFIEYIRRIGVSFIAIDEAHCISQWGHDFRPEYRELRVLRDAFPDASLHAFTATATPHVRDDIVQELSLRDPRIVIGSFDRPNLVYRIVRRDSLVGQVRSILDRHAGNPGIIYCISRKKVDELSGTLRDLGYKALPYHAGMTDADRKHNQDAFARDEADIIVATIAFGMGIDKSNVRFVVHAELPKSLEHYQQETGRAGRDGLESECWLFYSHQDFMLWKSILEKNAGGATDIALRKLNDMLRYATELRCRRRKLLQYFGELYPNHNCNACDACLDDGEKHELSASIAAAILDCVNEIGDIAGPTYTRLILCGEREERVLAKGGDRLRNFGALKHEKPNVVRDWIEQLVAQGYLEKTGEYNVLRPGGRASDDPELARARLAPSVVAAPKKASKGAAILEQPEDRALFEALRALRKHIADERNVAAFVVFSDASLREMAVRKPRTLAALKRVQGVGERKASDLGDEFVRAIREFCEQHNVETTENGPAPVPKREKSRSQEYANQLFSEGRTLEEVGHLMGRATSTVEKYLIDYLETAQTTNPEPWANAEMLERVRAAANVSEDGRLKPIFDALSGEVSYPQIRVCLACIRNGA